MFSQHIVLTSTCNRREDREIITHVFPTNRISLSINKVLWILNFPIIRPDTFQSINQSIQSLRKDRIRSGISFHRNSLAAKPFAQSSPGVSLIQYIVHTLGSSFSLSVNGRKKKVKADRAASPPSVFVACR